MAFWRKKYKTADPSTYEKIEGVGEEAYYEWKRRSRSFEVLAPRVLALIDEVSDRVRVKPIVCPDPDGEVYVHPELARELEKPVNEAGAVSGEI
jgi:hypothetical protein